ncbi:hypothetical protein MY1884_000334 [Beauveria asiatica]
MRRFGMVVFVSRDAYQVIEYSRHILVVACAVLYSACGVEVL